MNRLALLESIGTCEALADTSDTTKEYVGWQREARSCRDEAGVITEAEEAIIAKHRANRVVVYEAEAQHA